MDNSLLYQIALTKVSNIGPVQARLLLEKMPVQEIFKSSVSTLEKIEGIGSVRAKSIVKFNQFSQLESEIEFIEKYKIRTLFFTDDVYPTKLKRCYDAPVLLYFKGNAAINESHIIAIVGSRTCTDYGKEAVKKIVQAFKDDPVIIVSGLAHGIDTYAHKMALEYNLPTIGVLAHGLDIIYPLSNKKLAKDMVDNGGLLTEFTTKTNPDKFNFPSRNRIVAGLADAVIVVETDIKGGSLITADIADSYGVDVYAVPGSIFDHTSKGTNFLIKSNRAILLDDVNDLKLNLGWATKSKQSIEKDLQKLLEKLSDKEKAILQLLMTKKTIGIDEIINTIATDVSEIATTILSLEMMNIITVLPGKQYKFIL